ncbi:uncharacterized protein IL334_006107 [Kwoniella shivajii]|uniref:F-box domain-containing protein n=1 Tax=Kwoniella shivajii TaxID=564305 RepID=A0ABZ1D5C2_9TREE|nr:hypothetical protein IL334_006107 [Kwoniella shivajii]
MDDHIRSGFGAEATDIVVEAVSQKPTWHLVPLPLSQVNPTALRSLSIRGVTPSLKSCCLTVISKHLHKYTLESFDGIPPIFIQRIMSRVRGDRGYEEDYADRVMRNPDEATVWSLSALLDPEGTRNDFTLSLNELTTLQFLTPNNLLKYAEHPLIELPKLYQSINLNCGISLLTTLTLDGMDGLVNDTNIQSLKWCTNLTVLWMKGCRITDTGIRLLTSSLKLPGSSFEGDDNVGRGLWRLRAWSLGGCRGITDKSMMIFARYPGLVLLDVRDTSCTTSGVDIHNRTSQNLFSGYNPDFQPCTDGLLELFSRSSTSSEILDKLCLTLIKLPLPPSHTLLDSERSHLALHIIPSHRPLDDKWLPEPPIATMPKAYVSRHEDKDAKTVYRGNGVGQIYGSSVSRITNETKEFRKRVRDAMDIENKLDKEAYEERLYEEMGTIERRKFTMRKNKERKAAREWWKDDSVTSGAYKKATSKTYKQRGKKGDNERSKSFVMGQKGEQVLIDRTNQNDRSFMLVRIVNSDWQRLSWLTISGSTSISERSDSSKYNSELVGGFVKTSSQKLRAANIVEDLLGSAMSISSSTSFSQSKAIINPFKLETPSSSQFSSSQTSISSSPSSSQTPRNPFKSQIVRSNSMGIRPLSSTPSSTKSLLPTQSHSPSQSYNSQTPFRSMKPPPFSQSMNSNSDTLFDIEQSSSARGVTNDLSFSGSARKRTFDGSSSALDMKRKGMKMFSSGSGRI